MANHLRLAAVRCRTMDQFRWSNCRFAFSGGTYRPSFTSGGGGIFDHSLWAGDETPTGNMETLTGDWFWVSVFAPFQAGWDSGTVGSSCCIFQDDRAAVYPTKRFNIARMKADIRKRSGCWGGVFHLYLSSSFSRAETSAIVLKPWSDRDLVPRPTSRPQARVDDRRERTGADDRTGEHRTFSVQQPDQTISCVIPIVGDPETTDDKTPHTILNIAVIFSATVNVTVAFARCSVPFITHMPTTTAEEEDSLHFLVGAFGRRTQFCQFSLPPVGFERRGMRGLRPALDSPPLANA